MIINLRGSLLVGAFSLLLSAPSVFAGPLEKGNTAFLEQDYKAAITHFTSAYRTGDADAGYNLGRMFELGLGVKVDVPAALRFYQSAAGGNHVAAMNRVALAYYRGEQSVAQDYKQALDWFGKATTAGDPNATFNLGKMHFEGKGTARDTKRAVELYRIAAASDHILALNTLGGLFKASAKSEDDLEQSRGFFTRSAIFGNAVGLFEVGELTLKQNTSPESLRKAHTHFNLASARGHPKAAGALQELTALMSLEDIELAQDAARSFVALRGTEVQ